MLDFVNWKHQNKVIVQVFDEDENYRGDVSVYPTTGGRLVCSSENIYLYDWDMFDVSCNLRAFEIGFDNGQMFIKAEEYYNYTPIH